MAEKKVVSPCSCVFLREVVDGKVDITEKIIYFTKVAQLEGVPGGTVVIEFNQDVSIYLDDGEGQKPEEKKSLNFSMRNGKLRIAEWQKIFLIWPNAETEKVTMCLVAKSTEMKT